MADLGRKHLCFKCSAKFYDLKKAKALCPKCGADQVDAPLVTTPPPQQPQKRGPRMVDPVEEVPEVAEEDADAPEDAELDVEGDEDTGAVEEELDEPAGGDSYE